MQVFQEAVILISFVVIAPAKILLLQRVAAATRITTAITITITILITMIIAKEAVVALVIVDAARRFPMI